MLEKKTKIEMPGLGMVDAIQVSVSESTERWTEVKLDDGSVLRVKPVVLGAMRIDGRYDQEGNPLYALKANQVMTVLSSPDHLRKGGGGTPKGIQ